MSLKNLGRLERVELRDIWLGPLALGIARMQSAKLASRA
jgi:hypothetical protein